MGGWKNGGPGATVVLAGSAAIAATVATRGIPSRWLWVLTAAVLGLALAGFCIDAAPWSAGHLAAELDRPRLDFYVKLEEHRAGSSWCLVTNGPCPSVTRVYRAPYTSEFGTVAVVVSSLRTAGVIDVPNDSRLPRRLDLKQTREDYVVIAQTTTLPDTSDRSSPFRVRLHLAARS